MQRVLKALIIAIASLGFAAGAMAQKAEAPKADAKKPAAEAPKAAPAKTPEPPKADAPKAELIDINSASEKELASLKGIGDVRSKAIVKGRPYKGKDDLVKKKIVPQSVYDEIKDQIIAKQKPAEEKKPEPPKAAAEPAKAPAPAKTVEPAKTK
jgi:DNA uptake protein ComE-like DNA-binding protein